MTVPDAVSASCELDRHHQCGGVAISVLTDRIVACLCRCHREAKR